MTKYPITKCCIVLRCLVIDPLVFCDYLVIGIWCLVIFFFFESCSGCPRRGEEILTVTGAPVTLNEPAPPAPVVPTPSPPPTPQRAVIPSPPREPTAPAPDLLAALAKSGPPPVPPGATVATDLTQRLKEKLAEVYGGEIGKVPDAKIYLGSDTLDAFSKFYEQRGYKTQRVSIPVSQIIQAAIRDRQELSEQVRLEDYEGVVIEQVMVDGTGVSAADKYIDPDTLKVVDRLFITMMPLR